MENNNIAYVLLRFPCLTETFIAEEIQKLLRTGLEIRIYSLLPPDEELIQPVSKSLLVFSQNTPGVLSPGLWFAQFSFLLNKPGCYFSTLRTLLKHPAHHTSMYFKRAYIFLKSVWIAFDLRKKPVQLVHSHFAWLSAAGGWIISELLDLPFTVTAHAFDIFTSQNDLLTLIADKASRIITISEYNKATILQKCPNIPEGKVQVIHCGIDQDLFSRKENISEPDNTPIQITSVGSLIEKKGHEYLISACKELKNQGIRFNCVIIGSGQLESKLQQQIINENLEGIVTLTGKRSQDWIQDRLQHTDLFILACVQTPSADQDGIPVSMMEALSMEVPVISTRVSGIPELIRNEETGLLVDEKDSDAIAQAAIRIMKDSKLRRTIVSNGKELVDKEYNIFHNVLKLKQVFSEIIDE